MQRMLELVLLRDHVGRLAAKLVLTVAVLKKTLTIVIPALECKAKTARESIVSKGEYRINGTEEEQRK